MIGGEGRERTSVGKDGRVCSFKKDRIWGRVGQRGRRKECGMRRYRGCKSKMKWKWE